jgi:hypothetical protein
MVPEDSMKNSFARSACFAALTGLVFLSFSLLTDAQDLPKQSQSAEPTKLEPGETDLMALIGAIYTQYSGRLGYNRNR